MPQVLCVLQPGESGAFSPAAGEELFAELVGFPRGAPTCKGCLLTNLQVTDGDPDPIHRRRLVGWLRARRLEWQQAK